MTILERFEGDFALLEINGELSKVHKKFIDGEVSEGDVLVKKGDIYYSDLTKTKARREKLAELTDSLFE